METLKIISDYQMPAVKRGTGATGSKFYTKEVAALANQLKEGQAFLVPLMTDVKPSRQLTGTKWQFKQNFTDGSKEFLLRMTDDGLAVQLIKDNTKEEGKEIEESKPKSSASRKAVPTNGAVAHAEAE